MHSWPFADFGGDNRSPSLPSSRCVQPIGRNQKMPNYLEFCGFKKCDQRSIF